jgi:hypothetical protein
MKVDLVADFHRRSCRNFFVVWCSRCPSRRCSRRRGHMHRSRSPQPDLQRQSGRSYYGLASQLGDLAGIDGITPNLTVDAGRHLSNLERECQPMVELHLEQHAHRCRRERQYPHAAQEQLVAARGTGHQRRGRVVVPYLSFNASAGDGGRSHNWTLNPTMDYRIASRLTGSLSYNFGRSVTAARYNGNFGDLRSDTTHYTLARGLVLDFVLRSRRRYPDGS